MSPAVPATQASRPQRRTRVDGGTGIEDGQRLLCEAFLSQALLTRREMLNAVKHAEENRLPLADAAVALGCVGEHDAYLSLAQVTGRPMIELSTLPADPTLSQLLPSQLARRLKVVPVAIDDRDVTFATSRPWDDQIARDVSFATGRRAVPVLAAPSDLDAALDRFYPIGSQPQSPVRRPATAGSPGVTAREALSSTASPIEFCHGLILEAARSGASDIHIEPSGGGATVRFRVGGVLEPVLNLPAEKLRGVVNRLKVLAHADISVRNRPQDGSFRIAGGREIDVRLSTLPTVDGEAVVLRVVHANAGPQDLDSLGFDANVVRVLQQIIDRPDGLVVVTGPPGSGKSTVLYAALTQIVSGSRTIVTIEDPVERRLEGTRQINVDRYNSYATAVTTVLRQDADVIMLGELRDPEAAQIAGQAALTGHLVLTTLHSVDAIAAFGRLAKLGIDSSRLSEALNGVVALRLIRMLCRNCRVLYTEIEARKLGEPYGLKAVPAHAGGGCRTCRNTGYVAQSPLVELLVPDDEIRGLIGRGADAGDIRAAARAAGWMTLRDAALALVGAGLTSLEEMDRVLSSDVTTVPVKPAAPAKILPYPMSRDVAR